jgi:hypothetical protein
MGVGHGTLTDCVMDSIEEQLELTTYSTMQDGEM